ncbi:MAG: gamma-butyrobetaine hydroxylase-like domain-containing protein [Rhodanobacteraceae bacterium]
MPRPTDIILHRASHTLEVAFDNGERFILPCEYLRVHSPSAEVQGHGPGQQVLVAGKREVNIDAIEPVGNYGVLLRFSDGHATGIFSWSTLHELGINQERNWKAYLEALEKNGLKREPQPSPYGHPVPMRGPAPK